MSDSPVEPAAAPRLRAIVSVPKERRVLCSQPGCGHSVYQRIHVVQDGRSLFVLGSTCFSKRYGGESALGEPGYGGAGGKELTDAERELLVNNTAELLSQLEEEDALAQEAERIVEAERLAARESLRKADLDKLNRLRELAQERTRRPASHQSSPAPWSWMKERASMALFKMPDGTCWIRVTHADGSDLLVPWPKFDGWDESLPAHVGTPHPSIEALMLANVVDAVSYLRPRALSITVHGLWRDLLVDLGR